MSVKSSKLAQVLIIELIVKDEDKQRIVTQFWSLDGVLLATIDPGKVREENVEA